MAQSIWNICESRLAVRPAAKLFAPAQPGDSETYAAQFPPIQTFTVEQMFEWAGAAMDTHFRDGGVSDQPCRQPFQLRTYSDELRGALCGLAEPALYPAEGAPAQFTAMKAARVAARHGFGVALESAFQPIIRARWSGRTLASAPGAPAQPGRRIKLPVVESRPLRHGRRHGAGGPHLPQPAPAGLS